MFNKKESTEFVELPFLGVHDNSNIESSFEDISNNLIIFKLAERDDVIVLRIPKELSEVLAQGWATYGPQAGSRPRQDFDRPT